MKTLRRLKQALKDSAKKPERPKIKMADWLATQPGSTWRGLRRGHFVLPRHVIPDDTVKARAWPSRSLWR
jgi:hypothetical protein